MPHFMVLAADADPVLLQAVLELPNYASGITDEARVLVTNHIVERNHPGVLAKIEEAESAVELLDAAARDSFNVVACSARISERWCPDGLRRNLNRRDGRARRGCRSHIR
jgi:hypothetical protein